MLDWNDYRDELKTRSGEVGKLSPDTVLDYATLRGAGAGAGRGAVGRGYAPDTRDI